MTFPYFISRRDPRGLMAISDLKACSKYPQEKQDDIEEDHFQNTPSIFDLCVLYY
jgi:hypothetical protein